MKNCKEQLEVKKNHQIIEEGKNDSSVRDALKKEKQPTFDADLSPLQNTHQVGTSGGDQRDNDTKPVPAENSNSEDPLKNAIGSQAKVSVEEPINEEKTTIEEPLIKKEKLYVKNKK